MADCREEPQYIVWIIRQTDARQLNDLGAQTNWQAKVGSMIAIGVCTRERPKMLTELLESCVKAIQLSGEAVIVIVVENGPKSGAKGVVAQFSARINITWRYSALTGLTNARNTVIDAFLETNADWLAFVDDDETVAPDWLVELLAARQKFPDTSVFVGPTHKLFPDNASPLVKAITTRKLKYGARIAHGGTGNSLLQRWVFADDGAALRFDMRYNLVGGEDADLFLRVGDSGGIIRHIPTALAYAIIPAERTGIGYQIRKWHHQAQINGNILSDRKGPIRGRFLAVILAVKLFVRATAHLLLGALVLVGSERRGLYLISRAIMQASRAFGFLTSIWRSAPPIYLSVDGQ